MFAKLFPDLIISYFVSVTSVVFITQFPMKVGQVNANANLQVKGNSRHKVEIGLGLKSCCLIIYWSYYGANLNVIY